MRISDWSSDVCSSDLWEQFTDAVIAQINAQARPVVFLLWGDYAQRKAAFVDTDRHLVLKAPHPSPLSAHNGFFGCRHFSKTNAFLEANGMQPIDWTLPELEAADLTRGQVRDPPGSSAGQIESAVVRARVWQYG